MFTQRSYLNHKPNPELASEMYALAEQLWPISRSLTGAGNRETLKILRRKLPQLKTYEVQTGTKCLDWTIPREWRVSKAYVVTPSGQKICDFAENNLHLVGYSTPFTGVLSLGELQRHLHSLPEQPTAIPYVTSYYGDYWGFCISDLQRSSLVEGRYRVVVETALFEGSLTFGEIIIPGEIPKEIFLSTYICHPSMANNELSGPVVTTFLANWLLSQTYRRYSYRIIFIPETIGSVCYLSMNLGKLKENVVAGYNVSCVGDDRSYSYLPSRSGNTLSDKVAKHVLKWLAPDYKSYTWTHRGSDERQYCSPGVDLPIASIMRTKYNEYPEYHTSLDALGSVVTQSGLLGGFSALRCALEVLERNCYPRATVLGEPQLGRRGLYPSLSTKGGAERVKLIMDLLTWSDGKHSLLEIAEICNCPIWALYPLLDVLCNENLLVLSDYPA
jgi:aminopeptidase-like protein